MIEEAFPSSFSESQDGMGGSVSLSLLGDRTQVCNFWCSDSLDLWTAVSEIAPPDKDFDFNHLMSISDTDLPVCLIDNRPYLLNRIRINVSQIAALVDFVGQTANYADYLQKELLGGQFDA